MTAAPPVIAKLLEQGRQQLAERRAQDEENKARIRERGLQDYEERIASARKYILAKYPDLEGLLVLQDEFNPVDENGEVNDPPLKVFFNVNLQGFSIVAKWDFNARQDKVSLTYKSYALDYADDKKAGEGWGVVFTIETAQELPICLALSAEAEQERERLQAEAAQRNAQEQETAEIPY